jgi:hypothetical protein
LFEFPLAVGVIAMPVSPFWFCIRKVYISTIHFGGDNVNGILKKTIEPQRFPGNEPCLLMETEQAGEPSSGWDRYAWIVALLDGKGF